MYIHFYLYITNMHTHICTYVHMFSYIHIYTCMCMYIHSYVWYMRVLIWICINTLIHVHVYTYICAHVSTNGILAFVDGPNTSGASHYFIVNIHTHIRINTYILCPSLIKWVTYKVRDSISILNMGYIKWETQYQFWIWDI